MSGVKRFEGHYLAEGVMGGKALAVAQCVLASDYDRDMQTLRAEIERLSGECEGCPMAIAEDLRIERDELRAQVEAMRAALEVAALAMWNSEANMDNEAAAAEEALAGAALQAKP